MVIPHSTRPLSVKSLDREPGLERRGKDSSAILMCELTAVTPIIINSAFKSMTNADSPYLPAASIRGMVRNMMEMLGASCLRLVDAPARNAPESLKACSRDKACLTCRTLGFTEKEKEGGCASKVFFSDAKPVPPAPGKPPAWKWQFADVRRQYAGQPPPVDGWAIFAHGDLEVDVFDTPGGQRTRCLSAGSPLRFRVEFINLDPEAKALFLFALTLRYQSYELCHKLGYAKALGLGACTIRILNPDAPAIGPEVEPYLASPPFQHIYQARRLA
ncbi:MAG: hypothetical protein K2X03_01515 [Bryobacteraceae bacterium]|nr:hypothetical protein [Bryobacteraceae bacterium]